MVGAQAPAQRALDFGLVQPGVALDGDDQPRFPDMAVWTAALSASVIAAQPRKQSWSNPDTATEGNLS